MEQKELVETKINKTQIKNTKVKKQKQKHPKHPKHKIKNKTKNKKVCIVVTHGLISAKGLQTINEAECIHELIMTNSVELDTANMSPKVRVVDISKTFAEAIRRAHNGESVSYLFTNVPE